MTKNEALKMAIEALEMAHDLQLTGILSFKKYKLNCDADIIKKLEKTLNACKEALATNKESSLVQPVQEPVDVARVQEDGYVEWREGYGDLSVGTKLYTHPAQPLSDDAVNELWLKLPQFPSHIDVVRAIEKAHGIGVNDD